MPPSPTTADLDAPVARRRLDRRILHANLVSGYLLLLPLLVPGAWVLALIGAAYVAVASVILAAVHGRAHLTRTRELAAWSAPWVLAVVLWTALLTGIEADTGGLSPGVIGAALVVATPAYLVWQAAALAVRQFLAALTPSGPSPVQLR